MNRTEFFKCFLDISERAMFFSAKARREGLLALEDDLFALEDELKFDGGKFRVLKCGLRLTIDGLDSEHLNKILTNIVEQEKDEQLRILKTIQKEAVLSIQEGMNTRLLSILLQSYIDTDDPEFEAEVKAVGLFEQKNKKSDEEKSRKRQSSSPLDGALTQDEIEALLAGVDEALAKKAPQTPSKAPPSEVLSKDEIDALLAAINEGNKRTGS